MSDVAGFQFLSDGKSHMLDKHQETNQQLCSWNLLKVGSLNVNGIRNKIMAVKQLLISDGLDVLILLETRHSDEFEISIPSYIHFETQPTNQGGVICLCKEYLKPRLINAYSNQSLTIMVHHGDRRTYVIGVYNHQGNMSTYGSVQAEAEQILRNWINPGLLIAGDFNDCMKRYQDYFKDKAFYSFSPPITWERKQTLNSGEQRILQSSIDGAFSTKRMEEQISKKLPWTDHSILEVSIKADVETQKFIGTIFTVDRVSISKLLRQHSPQLSLLDDYRSWITSKVKKKPISVKIARPEKFYNDPYTVEWARKDKELRTSQIEEVLQNLETDLEDGRIGKFYGGCRKIFKELKRQSFAKSPICKDQTKGFEDYYQEMFTGNSNFLGWNDWIDIDLLEGLDAAIEIVKETLPRGKALGDDLFPDDALPKEELQDLIDRDARRLLSLPLPDHLLQSRGLLLSKTGREVVAPDKTRLINILPFPLKIVDKLTTQIVSDELWRNIGNYQRGFRKGARTFDNIEFLMKNMKYGERGKKRKTYLIFFDLKKAFDSIDRTSIADVLDKRLGNKEQVKLVKKLLLPMKITFGAGGSFACKKGVPQGMCISPILFNTILDYELKKQGLLKFKMLAWADDLVYVAHSTREVCSIVNKMRRLGSGLEVNLAKSSLLVLGDDNLACRKQFMEIPIQQSVKYLGIRLFSNATETLKSLKKELKDSLTKLRLTATSTPLMIRLELLWRIQQARLLYQVIPFYTCGLITSDNIQALQVSFLRKTLGLNNSVSTLDVRLVTGIKILNLAKLEPSWEFDDQRHSLVFRKATDNVFKELKKQQIDESWRIQNNNSQILQTPQESCRILTNPGVHQIQQNPNNTQIQDWKIRTLALKLLQNRHFSTSRTIVQCKEHDLPIGKAHYCFMNQTDQERISRMDFSDNFVVQATAQLKSFLESVKPKFRLLPEKLTFIGQDGPVMQLIRKLEIEKRQLSAFGTSNPTLQDFDPP